MKYIHVNSMLELPESARDQTFEGEEKSSIQMLMKIWNIFFSLRFLLPRQLNIESKKKTTKCSCLFVLTISETSIHSIQFEHWLIKRFKSKLALCTTTSMCVANFIHTCLQMAGICIAIKICI